MMAHAFGGNWTDQKLDAFARYMKAYATALQYKPSKDRPFVRLYVDAFAGTGTRAKRKNIDQTPEVSLFGHCDEEADVVNGSAVIALETMPRFSRYIFIEKRSSRAAELQSLVADFSDRNVEIVSADANEALVQVAKSTDWRGTRALVFIDPYGMQVSWSTLQALAETRAVDIALLFPTGPLNRMLTRDGDIPEAWQQRIDDHLGCKNWRDSFYATRAAPSLFGDLLEDQEKTATVKQLREFAISRLRQLFPWVCEEQLPLMNSKRSVLYHLFIICANPSPKAGDVAMRLAKAAIRPSRTRKAGA